MDSKTFLTRGPEASTLNDSLLGIKFISINGILELIGEITHITNAVAPVALVRDPIVLSRDQKNRNHFNLMKFSVINPVVEDELQIPISSITFMCSPRDYFIKNYMAARAGLVTASLTPNDIRNN